MAKKAKALHLGSADDTPDDLPDEWIPSELRPPEPQKRKREAYAASYETVWKGDNPRAEYKTFAGPFLTLHEALECAPPKDSIEAISKRNHAVIVRFGVDGADEVLYRWAMPMSKPHHWKRTK